MSDRSTNATPTRQRLIVAGATVLLLLTGASLAAASGVFGVRTQGGLLAITSERPAEPAPVTAAPPVQTDSAAQDTGVTDKPANETQKPGPTANPSGSRTDKSAATKSRPSTTNSARSPKKSGKPKKDAEDSEKAGGDTGDEDEHETVTPTVREDDGEDSGGHEKDSD